MYDNLGTTLSGSVDSSVTTIPVTDTTGWPTAGLFVIDGEKITYTGKTTTTFTGCTRGAFISEGGAGATSHIAGAPVEQLITARHLNVLSDAIRALEAKVGTTAAAREPISTYYVKDDFGVGTAATGAIGELRWTLASPATGALQTVIVGNLGHFRVGSSATLNAIGAITLRATGGALQTTPDFDMRWVLRLGQASDTATIVRMGSVATATGNPPTDGIYFEKLAADTAWFAVCRNASAQTRNVTGVNTDANFHRFEIVRRGAAVMFYIDGALVSTISTSNVPNAAQSIVAQVGNNVAVEKFIDIDFFDLAVYGMTR
jgi:hypothetical protein